MKNQRKNPGSRSDQGNRDTSSAGRESRSPGTQQPGGSPQGQPHERGEQKKPGQRGSSDFSQESSDRSALRRGDREPIQPQMNDEREREPLDAASLYEDNDESEKNLDLDLEDEDDVLRRGNNNE